MGNAIPYGVYDMTHHCGWVGGGVEHDTAACAVATVQQWWQRRGHQMYPQAQHVLMTADGGGSHGSRSRLWQVALQRFRDAAGLAVSVGHVPPGTSKWNKIAHRLFCHSTDNWRGRPLVSQEVIVNLIANTTTAAGRRVEAALDPTPYETGQKVSDEERAQVNLSPADFHGNDWHYVIKPRDENQ